MSSSTPPGKPGTNKIFEGCLFTWHIYDETECFQHNNIIYFFYLGFWMKNEIKEKIVGTRTSHRHRVKRKIKTEKKNYISFLFGIIVQVSVVLWPEVRWRRTFRTVYSYNNDNCVRIHYHSMSLVEWGQ